MPALDPVTELSLLLRPAGGGIFVVSTGRKEQLEMQKLLYGVATEEEVDARFRLNLQRIRDAKVVLLGIPSDTGAGYRRGANLAPQAIRKAMLEEHGDFWRDAEKQGVLDLGDVFVVPQLLHDEMLSDAQIAATRRAIYPNHVDAGLPVSPLSMAERALDLVFQLNPHARPVILGGDHSCAWPVISSLAKANREGLGIVQPDAHTDLLENRLGVRICYATWSWHANELLGRGGRLVQVGQRASRFPREHWEKTTGVRQFWANEIVPKGLAGIDDIVKHLKNVGVSRVYFSNDIDGTSDVEAMSTGTPEPDGLSAEFVIELIRRLSREFQLVAGDIVEVAPALGPTPAESARTVSLAAKYLRETIAGALR